MSARSASSIIAPISSPNRASTKGGVGEVARVVVPNLERLPTKVDAVYRLAVLTISASRSPKR
jgi:hypothetical protein